MRLQLSKIHVPENSHKYRAFEVCRSYTVAAEQKARATYDNILRLSDDQDVNQVIRYLRQREIVHFQRFGEALDRLQRKNSEKNTFFMGKQK